MSIYNYIHVCCLTFSIKTIVIKHSSLNIMQNTLCMAAIKTFFSVGKAVQFWYTIPYKY